MACLSLGLSPPRRLPAWDWAAFGPAVHCRHSRTCSFLLKPLHWIRWSFSYRWLVISYQTWVLGSELGSSLLLSTETDISPGSHTYEFVSSGYEMKVYSIIVLTKKQVIKGRLYIFRRKRFIVLMITKLTSSFKSNQ